MQLMDFFSYKTHCPCCNQPLIPLANFYLAYNKPSADFEFALPGCISYTYINNKFQRHSTIIFSNIDILQQIDKHLPATFTTKKKYFPRLNLSRINQILHPGKISILSYQFSNVCEQLDHQYQYNSAGINETELTSDDTAIQISLEGLSFSQFYISNRFFDNLPIGTRILNYQTNKTNDLPAIPINKWKFTNSIQEQIDKYKLLA